MREESLERLASHVGRLAMAPVLFTIVLGLIISTSRSAKAEQVGGLCSDAYALCADSAETIAERNICQDAWDCCMIGRYGPYPGIVCGDGH